MSHAASQDVVESVPAGAGAVRRIVVVGLGYVGLPSAVSLARAGFEVTGADVRRSVVEAIERGASPLAEAVPDAEIRELVEAGRLRATLDTASAVRDADFVIVCVPTPIDHDRKPDLGPLEKASHAIGRGLRAGTVVSYESTTFPGCTKRVCIPILEEQSGLKAGRDFGVSYCPERLNPGDSAHTVEVTPRVLGGLDERSLRVAASVYGRILQERLHLCPDMETAEAAKVLENVQRDVNIALVNEFAALSRCLGLDAHAVLEAAGTKYNFYPAQPGPGVGGHCIPVDPYYLIEEARRVGFEPRLMATAREVNDAATDAVAGAILEGVAKQPASKVALMGLSYKGGVGDLRESPALRLVGILAPKVSMLAVHDPYVKPDALEHAETPVPAPVDLAEAAKGASVLAFVTDHPEFKAMDWERLAKLAAPGALVVDARNVASPAEVRRHGLRYWGIGRGSA